MKTFICRTFLWFLRESLYLRKMSQRKISQYEKSIQIGTVVDGAFFTDREKESQTIGQLLESENHLVLNKTDRHILTILVQSATSPLDSKREMPTSTAFSALKRLSKQGYVIKNKKYEIDDPFFARWIFNRSL